jgi:alcohol dehydrogenase class IV
MQFEFQIVPRIYFGEGSSKRLGELVHGYGAKTVFFCYDKGVAKLAAGYIQDLKDSGLKVVEFSDIMPNPTNTMMDEAGELAREANADVVVALGGGSCIDTAKVVGILLTNPSPCLQYTEANDPQMPVKNPNKPLIAIPTTSGTGTEATIFTIITAPALSRKVAIPSPYVAANVAILDPAIMVALPPAVTAYTGMDALTHAIESYTAKNASPFTDDLAIRAIKLISQNIIEAYKNGSNVEARANMHLASLMAGIAFGNAFVGMVHAIAHPISAHCNVAHGLANATCLSYVMDYNAPVVPDRTIDIGVAMGLDLQGLSKEEACKKTVAAVQKLVDDLKIPKLSEVGVTEDKLEPIAKDAVVEIPSIFNAREVTKEACMEVLRKAFK